MLLCSYFLWAGFGQLNPEGATTVDIIRFSVAPNYPLCSDMADKLQISDNITERYPMWTRKGCVGWRQQGIVTVEGRLPQHPNKTLRGFFRIHVGAGEHANVFPPARIDIYSEDGSGNFLHVAEQIAPDPPLSERDHWIEVPARLSSHRFSMIFQPNGNYLFADEIQWIASQTVTTTKSWEKVGKIDQLAADASKRHQTALRQAAKMKMDNLNSWLYDVDGPKVFLWIEADPFGNIEGRIPQPVNGNERMRAQVHGYTSEKESLCLGAAFSGTEPKDFIIELQGEPALLNAIKIGRLEDILSADGTVVYDPIRPVTTGSHVRLTPKTATYFWLTIDFSAISSGGHQVDFILRPLKTNQQYKIPVSITAYPLKPHDSHKPFALNWGYVSDRPICRRPEKCIQDMVMHGINVFVIHPAHIPSPGERPKQFAKKTALLERDVRLLREKGRKILLFLHWDKKQPSEIEAKKWVTWIKSQMATYHLGPSDWALYPVDEPTGKKINLLVRYAKWIKEAEPSVAVYANPIDTNSKSITASDHKQLETVVDIWQPSIDSVYNQVGRLFYANKTSWWVFQNPPTPAKSASPLMHYRSIAWEAWLTGAKGIGFWAYADTTGSSAWDDFDGRRPDFAVVYEGPNGPISSRRWEAFREGVEDFQLFSAATERNPGWRKRLKSKVDDLVASDDDPLSALNEVRLIIFTDEYH